VVAEAVLDVVIQVDQVVVPVVVHQTDQVEQVILLQQLHHKVNQVEVLLLLYQIMLQAVEVAHYAQVKQPLAQLIREKVEQEHQHQLQEVL
tara:strand:- start:189 stop:461 length:273 start_codon:yes stop_codon:yes gene_type:complete